MIYCLFSACRNLWLAIFSEVFLSESCSSTDFSAHWWKIVIYGLRCAFHGRCGG